MFESWESHVGAGREHRITPDGCMDLVWKDGEIFVSGPDTRAFLVRPDRDSHFVGVRFAPGVLASCLAVPASILRDHRVPLIDVVDDANVRDLLSRARGSDDPARLLEEYAIVLSRRTHELFPSLRLLIGAVLRAKDAKQAAAEAGYSARQLQRRANEVFGYGPTQLRRILRFRMALRLAGLGVPFSEVAHRCGYADQPHLCREVRDLAGTTLTNLLSGMRDAGIPHRAGSSRRPLRPGRAWNYPSVSGA